MSTSPQLQVDWQRIVEWVKNNWVLVLIVLMVLAVVMRLIRRPRAVIY